MDATIGSERGRTVTTPGVAMQFGTNDQHKGPSLFRRQKIPIFFFFVLFSFFSSKNISTCGRDWREHIRADDVQIPTRVTDIQRCVIIMT